jgi:alkylation response protein AidB-like acyl-CoA dehydrogenase
VDIALDATAREWRERAFRFATDELTPWEVEAELHEGRLPPEVEKRHKELAVELGFSAMDVPKSQGGLELRRSLAGT